MKTVNVKETVVKNPGMEVWEWDDYIEEHGTLESNLKKGHYESTDEYGKRVVIIPDKKRRRIEFNERQQVVRERDIGDNSSDIQEGDLARRQTAIADSHMPHFKGGFLKKGTDVFGFLLGDGSTASASGSSPDGAKVSPAKPVKTPTPVAAATQAPPPTTTDPAEPCRGKKRARPSDGEQKPKAGEATAKAKGKAGRGRPKKDWAAEVGKLEAAFASSLPTDPVFWGAEAKTQLKIIGQYFKDIGARINALRNASV
jgi:hypothetical protein